MGPDLTLRYFVRDAMSASEVHGEESNYRYHDYPKSQKDLWLLDYLLDNRDRHASNWLRMFGDPKGRVVAIDHGIILGRGISNSEFRFYESHLPSGATLEKLKSVDFNALQHEFRQIDPSEIDKMKARRDEIVRAATSKSRSEGRKPVCKDDYNSI